MTSRIAVGAAGACIVLQSVGASPALAKADPRFSPHQSVFKYDGYPTSSGPCIGKRWSPLYFNFFVEVSRSGWQDLRDEYVLVQIRTGPGQPWRQFRRVVLDKGWVPGYKGSPGTVSVSDFTRPYRKKFLQSHRFRLLIEPNGFTQRAATKGQKAWPYCG